MDSQVCLLYALLTPVKSLLDTDGLDVFLILLYIVGYKQHATAEWPPALTSGS